MQQRDHIVGQLGARDVTATVRDEHDLDLVLPAEERLRLVERHEHRRVRCASTVERDDVAHAHGDGCGSRVDGDPRAGVHP